MRYCDLRIKCIDLCKCYHKRLCKCYPNLLKYVLWEKCVVSQPKRLGYNFWGEVHFSFKVRAYSLHIYFNKISAWTLIHCLNFLRFCLSIEHIFYRKRPQLTYRIMLHILLTTSVLLI